MSIVREFYSSGNVNSFISMHGHSFEYWYYDQYDLGSRFPVIRIRHFICKNCHDAYLYCTYHNNEISKIMKSGVRYGIWFKGHKNLKSITKLPQCEEVVMESVLR